MEYPNYSFIPAEIEHFDDYYKIRSEKKNLYWTGYSNAPDYNSFRLWFEQKLNDPDRHIYLMYDREECLGSLHIDYFMDYSAIGYSVKKSHEGKGIGTRLVKEAINLVKKEKETRLNLSHIKAWINQSNIVSIKVVERNGFIQENSEMRKRFGNYEVYLEFILNV